MTNSEKFETELLQQYREIAIFQPELLAETEETIEQRAARVYRNLWDGQGFAKLAVKRTFTALGVPKHKFWDYLRGEECSHPESTTS
jgi:hypothetical protein